MSGAFCFGWNRTVSKQFWNCFISVLCGQFNLFVPTFTTTLARCHVALYTSPKPPRENGCDSVSMSSPDIASTLAQRSICSTKILLTIGVVSIWSPHVGHLASGCCRHSATQAAQIVSPLAQATNGRRSHSSTSARNRLEQIGQRCRGAVLGSVSAQTNKQERLKCLKWQIHGEVTTRVEVTGTTAWKGDSSSVYSLQSSWKTEKNSK